MLWKRHWIQQRSYNQKAQINKHDIEKAYNNSFKVQCQEWISADRKKFNYNVANCSRFLSDINLLWFKHEHRYGCFKRNIITNPQTKLIQLGTPQNVILCEPQNTQLNPALKTPPNFRKQHDKISPENQQIDFNHISLAQAKHHRETTPICVVITEWMMTTMSN